MPCITIKHKGMDADIDCEWTAKMSRGSPEVTEIHIEQAFYTETGDLIDIEDDEIRDAIEEQISNYVYDDWRNV